MDTPPLSKVHSFFWFFTFGNNVGRETVLGAVLL